MSKAWSPDHLALASAAELARSELRAVLPRLPAPHAERVGFAVSLLTHALKARRYRARDERAEGKPVGQDQQSYATGGVKRSFDPARVRVIHSPKTPSCRVRKMRGYLWSVASCSFSFTVISLLSANASFSSSISLLSLTAIRESTAISSRIASHVEHTVGVDIGPELYQHYAESFKVR